MRVPLILAAGLTFAAAPALASDYRWWTTDEQDSAQFGVPHSDDRGFRIDCEASGDLSVMAPTGAELEDGRKLPVILQGKGGRRTVEGIMTSLGDGPNFYVDIKPDDDIVATLMAGGDVTIGSAGDEWTVPGKGAARALKPVLATCAGR